LIFYAPKTPLYGMTTRWEQAYFRRYAQKEYSGQGEIVDLGCWLGSSTVALAMGLEKNRKVHEHKKRIHAYDLFIWDSRWEKTYRNIPWKTKKPKNGDTFVDEYMEIISPWKHLIQVYKGDLIKIGWNGKSAIEILHNDASKNWHLTNSILQNFYPSLIPGTSIVIEQDFAHYYTSWIHLIRYFFRDYFQPICHIPLSGSMIFRYIKPIPEEFWQKGYDFASFSPNDLDLAFDYSLSLVSKPSYPDVLAAKVMLYIHLKDMDRAWYELQKAKNMGFYQLDLVKVKKLYFRHRQI
jgi:hypothetical protein